MKSSQASQSRAVSELPLSVKIKSFDAEVKMLEQRSNIFKKIDLFTHHKHLTINEIGNGAILCKLVSALP